jgi:hypothetical protein
MTRVLAALGRAQPATPRGLVPRLGATLNGLLDRWSDEPNLISGDADTALMATGRDLQTESRLFYRGRGR